MEESKHFRELYPIEHFPLLKEFLNNIEERLKDKNIYYPLIVKDSIGDGLFIHCDIEDSMKDPQNGKVPYSVFVSTQLLFPDLLYIACNWDTEENIKTMLAEHNEYFFHIDEWSKEDIQKYYINNILNREFCVD